MLKGGSGPHWSGFSVTTTGGSSIVEEGGGAS
jgi:hypothetical protein